jgi:hypothetical protein
MLVERSRQPKEGNTGTLGPRMLAEALYGLLLLPFERPGLLLHIY